MADGSGGAPAKTATAEEAAAARAKVLGNHLILILEYNNFQ